MNFTIGVVLITHNARHHLPYCLPPLMQSPLKPKILLMNSSSSDGTVELAKQFGILTHVIPREEFNHGVTRELARKILGTEIVIMTTPDAYAVDQNVIEKLLKPIIDGKAVCAYARQIPHDNADVFESYPREFNYPKESHIRSLKDVAKFGVYTFFFSDSFGAYLNRALDEIEGFPPVLTGEDTVVCSKLLEKGYQVAYVAEAEVKHSHRYSLKQEFRRHFDTGMARKMYREIILKGESDSKRGLDFILGLFKHLLKKKKIHLIPYAILQSCVKWFGYKLGQKSANFTSEFKKKFSDQDFYWTSIYRDC